MQQTSSISPGRILERFIVFYPVQWRKCLDGIHNTLDRRLANVRQQRETKLQFQYPAGRIIILNLN